ncbi:unnamed protein product, partial [marine sediment metagenome]
MSLTKVLFKGIVLLCLVGYLSGLPIEPLYPQVPPPDAGDKEKLFEEEKLLTLRFTEEDLRVVLQTIAEDRPDLNIA